MNDVQLGYRLDMAKYGKQIEKYNKIVNKGLGDGK